MEKKEKKQLTVDEKFISVLCEKYNLVSVEELKEKGIECTFSEKTHKLKIKSSKKKEYEDRIKEKFEKLQQYMMRYHNIKLSFTESYTVRCVSFINPKPTKRTKQTKQTKQTKTEQTVQQAA